MQPQPGIGIGMLGLKVKVKGGNRDDSLGLCHGVEMLHVIRTPHSLHTHSSSSPYRYHVFQQLLLWLLVIRMPPQPEYALSQRHSGGTVGDLNT